MGMLMLLSPAKTLDFSPIQNDQYTQPRLLAESRQLVDLLRKQDVLGLKGLMNISDQLAELNVKRYQNFVTPFTPDNAKPAVLAFQGDVYAGLQAEDFGAADWSFAQKHLRILSGLYGVLRPLDLMQPYRLEMGTKLKNDRGRNLYDFWGSRITNLLNEDLTENQDQWVLNLASKEYFSSVQPESLSARILNIDFKEDRDGKLKVISFNAKKARGAMARQIIQQKLTEPDQLPGLDVNGYLFRDDLSSPDHFVFVK